MLGKIWQCKEYRLMQLEKNLHSFQSKYIGKLKKKIETA